MSKGDNMTQKKNNLRHIISIVYACVLALMLFLIALFIGLSFSAFNNKVIFNKVSESNYYKRVHEELVDRCKDIVVHNGLPESILDDVITLERVYVEGRNYIDNTLTGSNKEIQTDKLEESLRANLNDYLELENIEVSMEVELGIHEMIARITQEYQRSIEFKFVYYIALYRDYVYGIAKWLIPVVLVITIALVVLLMNMFTYLHRGLRYILYALVSSSISIIAISSFLLLSGSYRNLTLEPSYYAAFIASFLKGSISVYLYIGSMGVLLSVLVYMLIGYFKHNMTKKRKKVGA